MAISNRASSSSQPESRGKRQGTGSQGRPVGLHHIFMPSDSGSLGARGFQTAAASLDIQLDEDLRQHIEDAVRALRAPSNLEIPIHQVVPIRQDGSLRRWLISRSIPKASTASERGGHFLVESFLVHEDWLASSGWDLDAVILSLPWVGVQYRNHLQPDDSLPPLPLIPVTPQNLKRLNLLTRLPGSSRTALVEAVVGLRPSRSAAAFVAGHLGQAPLESEDLERLIRLLPLLLPPTCRWTLFNEPKGRPLSLRTLADPRREQGTVDLEGFWSPSPGSRNMPARRKGLGRTVDLEGPSPAAPSLPQELLAYAGWLDRCLEKQDWGSLAALYRQHSSTDLPSHHELQRHGWKRAPILHPSVSQAGGALVDTVSQRRLLWNFREQIETFMQDLEQRLQDEIDDLQKEFLEQVQNTLAHHQKQVATARQEQQQVLKQMETTHRQLLDEIENARGSAVLDLQEAHRKAVQELQTHKQNQAQHLEQVQATPDGHAPPPMRSQQRVVVTAQNSGAGSWLTDNLWRTVVIVAVVAIGGFFGWRALQGGFGGDTDTDPPSGSSTASETNQDSGPDIAALEAQLFAALAQPDAASEVLTQALGRPEIESQAMDALLLSRLALQPEGLPKIQTCGLLQQIVGATVDGDCGAGSLRQAKAWLLLQGDPAPTAADSLESLSPRVFELGLGVAEGCAEAQWPSLKVKATCQISSAKWIEHISALPADKPAVTPKLQELATKSVPVSLKASSSSPLPETVARQLLLLAHRAYDSEAAKTTDDYGTLGTKARGQRLQELSQALGLPPLTDSAGNEADGNGADSDGNGSN